MRHRLVRSTALVLAWLLATSIFVAVPRAEAAGADADPIMFAGFGAEQPDPIAHRTDGTNPTGYGVSNFGSAAVLLAAAQSGSPCTWTDPDTDIEYDGTIDVRQVGRDHNDYDGNGSFNDLDDELVNLYAEDHGVAPQAPAGYRYEFDVCVSNTWPREPLSVDWHGVPYQLVLAENAVSWFETVRDSALGDAFEDKVPGWRIWPDRAHMQIVDLDSWLYVENYFGTLSSAKVLNASEGDQIEVRVEAVPTHSEWWVKKTGIDQESTFTCELGGGQGIAWVPDASGEKCGLHWDHSSPVIGAIDMRVRLVYDVTISSQTLNNDNANSVAGQSFNQFIPGHAGEWDVHPDGSVPQDYKLYVSEVLANGFDPTGEAATPEGPAAALGATPGGPQIGPSDSCWGPDVRCRVVSAVGGAILDFIIPEEVRALVKGCWDGAKSAAVGFGDLLSNLDPTTWDDKIAEMNELKDVLLEAHEQGELLDVLTQMGLDAGFDSLRLDIFDTVGDGNFGDLDFGNTVKWGEWIGAVGCEYLIGLFTGKAQQKLNDLLFNTRNRRNNNDDDGTTTDDDDGTTTDDDDGTTTDDDDSDAPIVCLSPLGGDSFPTGTPVLMADGSRLAIDLIEPGDRVMSYDVDGQVWRPQVVSHQWSARDDGQMSTVTLTDGASLIATDHHRFWVESDQAWTTIHELEPGDQLLTPHGAVTVQTSITGAPTSTLVWELSVDGDHNFTVSTGDHDLLVHNRNPDGCGGIVSETVDDRGDITTTFEDGTVEVSRPDNSTLTTYPDGTTAHVDGSGNRFESNGDDGSFSYTDADGNDVPLHTPDGRPVVDGTGRPIGEMTGEIDPATGVDKAWLDEVGSERYPDMNGTLDGETPSFIEAGDVVDRYGEPGKSDGSYLGDEGVPLEDRGITPLVDGDPKQLFTYESNVGDRIEVDGIDYEIPPMPVHEGTIAPWNDSPGGVPQYRTDPGIITNTYGPGTQPGGGQHPLFDQMLNDAGYPANDFWFNVTSQG